MRTVPFALSRITVAACVNAALRLQQERGPVKGKQYVRGQVNADLGGRFLQRQIPNLAARILDLEVQIAGGKLQAANIAL